MARRKKTALSAGTAVLILLALLAYLILTRSNQTNVPNAETPGTPTPPSPTATTPPPVSTGSELTIGFWNIRDFSWDDIATPQKEGSRTIDELRMIAKVVRSMDCIGICEINDTQVLSKLVAVLKEEGGQWDAAQTEMKSGNTPASSEYYGFVYRSDKLRVRSPPKILPEVQCPLAGEGGTHRFDREPASCSFATLDGRLDFTLVTVHVTWGERVEPRKAEIRALKKYFTDVRDADASDKDIILMGDFNRNVGDQGSLSELLTLASMVDTTAAEIPTVVKGENTYDHILFQSSYLSEYMGRHGVVTFDVDLFADNDDKAKEVCSDHRPVFIVLKVPDRDDD